MDLEELLRAMDRTAANLSKLDSVWDRAKQYIPSGPQRGSHPAYEDLAMAWADLLPGLPLIDGWTITDPLPNIDAMGQSFIDHFEISEQPSDVHAAGEKPGVDLAAYRYRLERARRRAARGRLEQLVSTIDAALPVAVKGVARDSLELL